MSTELEFSKYWQMYFVIQSEHGLKNTAPIELKSSVTLNQVKKATKQNICNGMVERTTTTSVPKLLSSVCVVDKGLRTEELI